MNAHEWVIKTISDYKVKIFAEIGVFDGDLADKVTTKFPDIFYFMIEAHVNPPLRQRIDRYCLEQKPICLFSHYSDQAVKVIANGSLDMVYIDAGHTYEETKHDNLTWVPKVRDGGIVSGHDYHPDRITRGRVEVWKAVDELINNFSLVPDDSMEKMCVWWALKDEWTLKRC